MISHTLYLTKSGVIATITHPTFTLGYAVLENEKGDLTALFALKPNGDKRSPYVIFEESKKVAPHLNWQPSESIGDRGHTPGAPNRFATYRLVKNESGGYDLDGPPDMVAALVQPVAARTPFLGTPISDSASIPDAFKPPPPTVAKKN